MSLSRRTFIRTFAGGALVAPHIYNNFSETAKSLMQSLRSFRERVDLVRPAFLLALVLFFVGCGTSRDEVRQVVRDEMSRAFAPKYIAEGTTIGPYTPAVRVGNFLFLSGQIGLDPASGNLKADSIETETRQVLRNIDRLLRAEGFDSSNVISASVYLREMNNFARMNAIYGSYFPQGKYPVRTTVAVADLPKRANVEIAVIAYK